MTTSQMTKAPRRYSRGLQETNMLQTQNALAQPACGATTITIYQGARNPRPVRTEALDWQSTVEALRVLVGDEAPNKLSLPAFAPHRLLRPHRKDENVEAVTTLVIDVDQCDLDALGRRIDELQIAAVLYGSPSDDANGAVDARRVRVVAPTTREIAPAECADTRKAFAERLGLRPGCGVEGALDAARLFFVGRLTGTPTRAFLVKQGGAVDVDALLATGLEHDWRTSLARPPTAPGGVSTNRVARVVGVLYPHYAAGGRHELCRALGGWLAWFGYQSPGGLVATPELPWTEDELAAVVKCLPSDRVPARVTQALQAFAQARRGEVTIGWQALESRLGADESRRLSASALDDDTLRFWQEVQARGGRIFGGEVANDTRPDASWSDADPPMARGYDPAVEAAIDHIAAPQVGVFQRSGDLVHITREAVQTEREWRPDGAPTIREIPAARLREIIRSTGGGHLAKLAGDVIARGEWRGIRPLDAIATCPVMRRDGSILTESGYDAATRTLAEISIAPAIGETRADAQAALESLSDLVSDFPFASDAHRSAWLAMLLTVPARPAIDGPTPLGLLEATARGSGKTLLADVIATITTGGAAPRRIAPKTKEEWDKSMLAWLMAGDPIALIDNVTNMLVSDALDTVLTGTHFKQRLLGVSESRLVAVRTVFLASANNARLSTDLVRRSIACRLEPGVECPETRTGFRRPDLLGHVRQYRQHYLGAALTILRAYAAAGQPRVETRPMGSYESWARVVRDALVWAGAADPVATQDALRESADVERDELRDLLTAWHAALGDRAVTTRELLDAAHGRLPGGEAGPMFQRGTPQGAELLDALRGVMPNGNEPTTVALGHRLRVMRGQIVGGLRLAEGPRDSHAKTATWRVLG